MIKIDKLYSLYCKHPLITTDTRNCPAGSLFFALRGERFNANEFAAKALENGCSYAIVDEAAYATDDRFILVDDVLKTLQKLAAYHRTKLEIPVIGITGTNGKTTTKELMHTVLSTRFKTLATEGNLNNHIGVPLTLLKITPQHQMAIIEMGANHPGEIEFLCNMVRPDLGLITNVGKAHLEGFGSLEGVIRTKTELYQSLRKTNGTAFLYDENELLKPYTEGLKTYQYGLLSSSNVWGTLTGNSPYVAFDLHTGNQIAQIQTHLIGSYNLPNLLAAAALGNFFQIPTEVIADALASYEPNNKRSQLIKTSYNTLVLDAYNANPTSMLAALKNFLEMQTANKTLILGDMRELGQESQIEHKRILDFIIESGFESVILIGKEFKTLDHPFTGFDNTNQMIEWLHSNPITDRFILIKGSRGIALESLVPAL